MPNKIANITIMLLPLWLFGCGQSNLYIAHDTVIGVNAAVNSQRTSGRLIVGYDRDFVTLVPKSVETPDGLEAMSVLSCSELRVDTIFLNEFTEYMATGKAAQAYAEKFIEKNDNQGKSHATEVFSCIQN